jgi:putative oxidoreductase
MSFAETFSPLLGRALLAWFFVSQAVDRLQAWDAMIVLLTMRHVPGAPLVLAVGALAMILGGLAVLVGFQTRFSALVLLLCTIGWLAILHDFWHLHDALERAADLQTFALGVALAGGLLVLMGRGAGSFAFDKPLS